MWKPLISGLVMFGSVMLVKSQSLGIVPTAKIILLVVCGTAIYILVSILINRRGFGEARDLLRATIMCRSEHGFEKIS
jgi:hypothetical protein